MECWRTEKFAKQISGVPETQGVSEHDQEPLVYPNYEEAFPQLKQLGCKNEIEYVV